MQGPIYAWTRKQWIRALAALVGFLAVWGFLRWLLQDKNEAVLVATALVLLWYTMETWALRWETVNQTREMRRQRELQIRPLLLVVYHGGVPAARNVGHGPAIGVRIESVQVGTPDQDAEIRFDPVDILTVGDTRVLTTHSLQHGKERKSNIFGAFLDPDPEIAPRSYDLTITFQDVEGNEYVSRVRFGPADYRLLGPPKKVADTR